MPNNATVLLLHSEQKSGHINKSQQRNVEGIAESNEAGHLVRGVDVERPREYAGLIGNDSDRAPLDASKTDYGILGKPGAGFRTSPGGRAGA